MFSFWCMEHFFFNGSWGLGNHHTYFKQSWSKVIFQLKPRPPYQTKYMQLNQHNAHNHGKLGIYLINAGPLSIFRYPPYLFSNCNKWFSLSVCRHVCVHCEHSCNLTFFSRNSRRWIVLLYFPTICLLAVQKLLLVWY